MFKKFQKLVLCFITAISIPIQERDNFEKIYERTFFEETHIDMSKALKMANSLYASPPNPLQKTKALVFSGDLCQAGNFKRFMNYAENVISLIKPINISVYYDGIGDAYNTNFYVKKYLKTFGEINAKNTIAVNDSLEKLNKRKGQINIAKNITIIILCIALIVFFIIFKLKQKAQEIKIRELLKDRQNGNNVSRNAQIEADFANSSVQQVFEKREDIVKKRNESLMTVETETKLLELLENFEKGDLFNNKNMSLPFLAGILNTNTKYLSYVINYHKNVEFKTYINRLRINYIIDKLAADEKYRQYKISILADECGFSSHSKFASVFKTVTNYSPSAYIKYLDSGNLPDHIVHYRENENGVYNFS